MKEIIVYFEDRCKRLESQAVKSEKRGNLVNAHFKRETAAKFKRFATILKAEVKS